MSTGEVRVRNLYGAIDGTWLIVETPLNVITPPTITIGTPGTSPSPGICRDLQYLGGIHDVFTRLCMRIGATTKPGPTGKVPAQQMLAAMFGVSQQSISRYISGAIEPDFTDALWSQLVRISLEKG